MDWDELKEKMGWNEDSQILHLEAFITKQGLWDQFVEYANKVAQEEEEG